MESILYIFWIGLLTGLSWYMTKIIKENFQEYKGKILWSLVFFPLLFILGGLGGGIIILCQLNKPYSLGPTNLDIFKAIIEIILGLVCGYFYYKEYKLLINFNVDNLDRIKKYTLYIWSILGITGVLMAFISGEENKSDNSFIEAVFALVVFGLIWYFSIQKLESFKKLITPEEEAPLNELAIADAPTFQKNNSEKINLEKGKDKLYQIKELLDQGILTQEEFEKMKKDILNKGI